MASSLFAIKTPSIIEPINFIFRKEINMREIWIVSTSILVGFIIAVIAMWGFSLLLGATIGKPPEVEAVLSSGWIKLILTGLFSFLIARKRFIKD